MKLLIKLKEELNNNEEEKTHSDAFGGRSGE